MSRNKLARTLRAGAVAITATIAAVLMLSSCTASAPNTATSKEPNIASEESEDKTQSQSGETQILNLREVKVSEEIAVVKTNMGSVKIMFFPEVAPKAVENFKELAKSGYYDNLTFHRVITDFMIQGGDPTGTGNGGESFFGKAFEDEFSEKAVNLRGALCMANSGANTNGSQFFIVQAPKETINTKTWDMLKEKNDMEFSDAAKKAYEENGGAPWLDFRHTVFGQVYEGMEIIDEISKVSVDVKAKPDDDVVIESVKLETAK